MNGAGNDRDALNAALDRIDWNDPLSYVREMYGVPATVGQRIRFRGNEGVIVGGDGQYIVADLGGDREPFLLHPTWEVEYVAAF